MNTLYNTIFFTKIVQYDMFFRHDMIFSQNCPFLIKIFQYDMFYFELRHDFFTKIAHFSSKLSNFSNTTCFFISWQYFFIKKCPKFSSFYQNDSNFSNRYDFFIKMCKFCYFFLSKTPKNFLFSTKILIFWAFSA